MAILEQAQATIDSLNESERSEGSTASEQLRAEVQELHRRIDEIHQSLDNHPTYDELKEELNDRLDEKFEEAEKRLQDYFDDLMVSGSGSSEEDVDSQGNVVTEESEGEESDESESRGDQYDTYYYLDELREKEDGDLRSLVLSRVEDLEPVRMKHLAQSIFGPDCTTNSREYAFLTTFIYDNEELFSKEKHPDDGRIKLYSLAEDVDPDENGSEADTGKQAETKAVT